MATGLVWDERFAWHDAGLASTSAWVEPYPALDRPEAKRRVWSLLQASGLTAHLVLLPSRLATEDELLRFHTPGYVERVRRLAGAGGGDTGESARISGNGYEIARLAAGSCMAAVDAVMQGQVNNAYALVRPCGHHAEPDRGRGFCIFANVVLAVEQARRVHGVKRVAVIDWDVHHGNSTQMAFYAQPDVLTISLHQQGCYPADCGDASEVGAGAGRGANINVPLPPGSGDGAWRSAFERVVMPAVKAFRPELIIVASGYDAAVGDPLGRMMCHSGTYRAMADSSVRLAEELCGGRLVVCQEGGYSPTYAPFCALAVIETLAGVTTKVADPWLGWYASMDGQALQPHQTEAIGAVVALHDLQQYASAAVA
ncbi:MAG: class II histone deacetylase [Burkholderiaceae bacterium]|nr:class II histone deacetylase [Burkholderiaceae bacterium]